MFENIRADLKVYNNNFFAQGFWAMLVYRFGRWRYKIKPRILRMPFSLIYKIWYKINELLTGIQLHCETQVGKNFRIDRFGNIIISGYTTFGDNCVVRSGVTIGLKNTEDPAVPKIIIGNNVDLGTGSKILGSSIKIGNNVKIGANAVVLKDIPDNCIAVGIPARVIPRNSH